MWKEGYVDARYNRLNKSAMVWILKWKCQNKQKSYARNHQVSSNEQLQSLNCGLQIMFTTLKANRERKEKEIWGTNYNR